MSHQQNVPVEDEQLIREIDDRLGREFADQVSGKVRTSVANQAVRRFAHAPVRAFVPLLALRNARSTVLGLLDRQASPEFVPAPLP